MDKFLAINKKYFNLTGKYKLNNKNVKIEILHLAIIAHIEEFERNKASCYLTNEQMANMFGVSIDSIKRAIKVLSDLKFITCYTTIVSNMGQSSKHRIMSVNQKTIKSMLSKVQNAPCLNNTDNSLDIDCETINGNKQSAKNTEAECKNHESKEQIAPIKEKKKDKEKDNFIQSKIDFASLSESEKLEWQDDIESGFIAEEDIPDGYYDWAEFHPHPIAVSSDEENALSKGEDSALSQSSTVLNSDSVFEKEYNIILNRLLREHGIKSINELMPLAAAVYQDNARRETEEMFSNAS